MHRSTPSLIYSMGDQADDILRSFLPEDDLKRYDIVKPVTIMKRQNVIFERAKFNARARGDC
jgi:hypothetical protein